MYVLGNTCDCIICEQVSKLRSVRFVLIPYSLSDLFCVAADKITYICIFYMHILLHNSLHYLIVFDYELVYIFNVEIN